MENRQTDVHVHDRQTSASNSVLIQVASLLLQSTAVFTWVTHGLSVTSASKFNVLPNDIIFDVNPKQRLHVTQCENSLIQHVLHCVLSLLSSFSMAPQPALLKKAWASTDANLFCHSEGQAAHYRA